MDIRYGSTMEWWTSKGCIAAVVVEAAASNHWWLRYCQIVWVSGRTRRCLIVQITILLVLLMSLKDDATKLGLT
ncbi:hypothetical protein [Paenibacillus harenae]|uniref:hypothetical protein n=1 Tax=Paenibacillus harenae TaxID=306543 RepID=UPI0027D87213|nr:hypothetical protein [Paenibacillus harenae]